jgi:ABC-type branched-subunit amino acid transport system permease subunit
MGAGLVGALYKHYIGFVSPKIVDTWINVVLAAMVIVGGEGTPVGPVVGSVLVSSVFRLILQESARGHKCLRLYCRRTLANLIRLLGVFPAFSNHGKKVREVDGSYPCY